MSEALAAISVLFAQHGPGRMPADACLTAEREYLRYRQNYNSSFLSICKFLVSYKVKCHHDLPNGFNLYTL